MTFEEWWATGAIVGSVPSHLRGWFERCWNIAQKSAIEAERLRRKTLKPGAEEMVVLPWDLEESPAAVQSERET